MALDSFPAKFLWGAATAAYQIEGAHTEDGRGESIWDRFSHTPGKTHQGETGDTACDHYHRYQEDVALMKDLGLPAYRFSISWPRIYPAGDGRLNQAGVDFYSRITDALLEAGIKPVPTLYHWDLPQALEDRGGWPNPETAERFGEYAGACFDALGDRIEHWITLNEPWCTAHLGYYAGNHAPGRTDLDLCLQAGHTLLLAHGQAVSRFRERCPQGKIGITDNFAVVYPASDSEEDHLAAGRWDAYYNGWFMDPIFRGEYPEELRAAFRDRLPSITEEQRRAIHQPVDFIGVNYYSPARIRNSPASEPLGTTGVVLEGAPVTQMGWEIYPRGLLDTLALLRDRYGSPVLYVTENGAAFDDTVESDGTVNDEARRLYLRDHLRAAHQAITEGVRLAGYFVWTLMDNFEWAFGYSRRFGIVYCDFETQRRLPKQSARWYARVIRQNGVSSEE